MAKEKEIIVAEIIDTEYSNGKPHMVIRFKTKEDLHKALDGSLITTSYKKD